jgi:hypothetical protein
MDKSYQFLKYLKRIQELLKLMELYVSTDVELR